MLTDSQLADFRSLALRVTNLANLYVLRQPQELPRQQFYGGYAMPPRRFSPDIQKHLERCGEWRGYHPCVVLNPSPHAEPQEVLGLFTHELSHVATCGLEEPTVETLEFNYKMYLQFTEASPGSPTDVFLPPYAGHESDFIRRALHLHSRIIGAGHALRLSELSVAGPRYGLSNILDYCEALDDEPYQLRNESLKQIELTPPPKPFSELYESDKAVWESQRRKKNAIRQTR